MARENFIGGLATLEVLCAPGFLDAVVARGTQLIEGLQHLQNAHPCVLDVRGLGLMVGCQLDDPGRVRSILERCARDGKLLLMNAGSDGATIRWMPPLTVTTEELGLALGVFGHALDACT